jgi:hypothetical protein
LPTPVGGVANDGYSNRGMRKVNNKMKKNREKEMHRWTIMLKFNAQDFSLK